MTTTTTTRKEKRTRPLSASSPPQPHCTRYVGYVKKCLSRTSETGRPPLSCTHIHLQSLRVARIFIISQYNTMCLCVQNNSIIASVNVFRSKSMIYSTVNKHNIMFILFIPNITHIILKLLLSHL